jgi:regulator of sigma E protease
VSYVIVIASLLAIVFIHELGHFGVALLVGMRPRSFYVGFPPAIVKIKRRGIEYGIGAIPLGGFVRIPGMHRPSPRDLQLLLEPAISEEPSLAPAALRVRRALTAEDYAAARAAYPELEAAVTDANLSSGAARSAKRALRDVEEGTAPDAYWHAPTWKRVAVIAAGPGANVLAAFLILFVLFATSGVPRASTNEVGGVEAGTPAAHAGLHAGDRIVAVNGKPAPTFDAISRLIRASQGTPVTVTVTRHGHRLVLGPERTVRQNGAWIWGFHNATTFVHVGVGSAATEAATDLKSAVSEWISTIGSLFHAQTQNISSGIGITRAGATALNEGARYYFDFLALISIALALMNLLPLLPLDGGHILFSLIEGVRRRALAREVYERVSIAGIALLLLVFVIAIQNDTGHVFG